MKPLFLLCLPLPPPYSGEEALGLTLQQAFQEISPQSYDLVFFDISSKQSNKTRGKINFGNLYATGRLVFKFLRQLFRRKPYAAYLPIAQNIFGFTKYSLFIQIAVLFHCKIIASFGGTHFHLFFERAGPLLKKWIQRTLVKIDILVVQGEALRQQFEGLIKPEKIRVVSLGVNVSPFANHPFSTKKEILDILFVGCLSKAKGVFELLEAIPLVVKKVPHVHFHLVGEILEKERNILHVANPKNNFEAFFEILNRTDVKPYVTLHGVVHVKDKMKLYKDSDIFVLPSYSESFPIVLLEAAAAGLALITTPVGSNPEIYKEMENVLFTKADHFQDLADKIVTLAMNPQLRAEMGRNNQSLVLRNYTHLHFGRRMDLIFSEMLP